MLLIRRQVRRQSFTLVELLFVITIIGIIAGMAFPAYQNVMTRANLLKAVANGKSIYTAAQQAAFDANSTGSANYGWPADIGSFGNAHDYFILLAKNDYLKNADLKILSVPGIQSFPGQDPSQLSARYVAFGLGNIGENDDGAAIFLYTKNWKPTRTSGVALNPTDKPFGDKGFAIIHKGGDAQSFKKQDAASKLPDNALGTVPVASPAFIQEPQGAAPGNVGGGGGANGPASVTPDLTPDPAPAPMAPAAEAPAAPAPAADAPAATTNP